MSDRRHGVALFGQLGTYSKLEVGNSTRALEKRPLSGSLLRSYTFD